MFIALLINSSYGRAFKAIREDEIAAKLWESTFSNIRLSFMIGAFAGVAYGLYGSLLGPLTPKLYVRATYNFLLIIVLGGMEASPVPLSPLFSYSGQRARFLTHL